MIIIIVVLEIIHRLLFIITNLLGGAGGGGKGQGEAFSKQGRVDWCLHKRLQLLAQTQRLCNSLGIQGGIYLVTPQ